MDNSSVHCSANVQKYMKENGHTWVYLPQYTPKFAPVECYSVDKKDWCQQKEQRQW